jgi:tryptophanyl-tRNA synthetase
MASSSSAPLRVLTGITPSGTPHLGNYVGSIRHSVRQSVAPGVESFFFLADYHALIKVQQPALIQRSTLEIAASWLACGLDPERVTFYRQSDIAAIPELTWFLTCVTGKGVLNRAHAYKAQLDKNIAKGEDPDADVTAGLFMYPVLMGADILMFNAHKVPVGRDQVQHIEMARDMAQRFNHQYGEHFTLPEAEIDDAVATLPGLDGRKMSKSYGNTIPLFAPRAYLQKQIASIVTDSRAPGRAQGNRGLRALPDLPGLCRCRGDRDASQGLRRRHRLGRRQATAVRAHRSRSGTAAKTLRSADERPGGDRAHPAHRRREGQRPVAALHDAPAARGGPAQPRGGRDKGNAKAAKVARPSFKQYRERGDGLFYFKLLDARGETLLQSRGFASPHEAGRTIAVLQAERGAALATLAAQLEPIDTEKTRAVTEALEALAEATATTDGS